MKRSRKSSWVQYIDENDANIEIVFSVTLGNGTVLNIDSEDATSVQKVKIHGFDGLLIEKMTGLMLFGEIRITMLLFRSFQMEWIEKLSYFLLKL